MTQLTKLVRSPAACYPIFSSTSNLLEKKETMPAALVREVLEIRENNVKSYASMGVVPSYSAVPVSEGEDIDMDELMREENININITVSKHSLRYMSFFTLVALTVVAVVMTANQMKVDYGSIGSRLFGSFNEAPADLTLPDGVVTMEVTSPTFVADGTMDDKYSCKLGTETGVSPPLAWSGAPESTVDYMITMKKESGYSWSVYDISSDINHVDEAVSNAAASGATVGQIAGTEAWDIDVPPYISTANYVSMYKYEEPCSKGPGSKWYLFTVYAFSKRAADVMAENNFSKENTKPTQILALMQDYVVGKGEITGYFNLYDDDQSAAAAKEETKEAEESGNTGATAGVVLSAAGKNKNGGSDPKHPGAVAASAPAAGASADAADVADAAAAVPAAPAVRKQLRR